MDDLCRTFLADPVAEDATKALRACVEGQQRVIAAAVPGAALMGVDAAMAAAIDQAAFGGAFPCLCNLHHRAPP